MQNRQVRVSTVTALNVSGQSPGAESASQNSALISGARGAEFSRALKAIPQLVLAFPWLWQLDQGHHSPPHASRARTTIQHLFVPAKCSHFPLIINLIRILSGTLNPAQLAYILAISAATICHP